MQDNRIRLSSAKIDFDSEFGNLGQDIDGYPPEGGQARFDHMRSVLLGLLAQQSSVNEPSQRRNGTPWFDLNTGSLKIWSDGEWRDYAEVIKIGSGSLKDWTDNVNSLLQGAALGSLGQAQSTSVPEFMKTVALTQAEYDAIENHDENTLYVIIE
jgi:hypothetical protein